MNSKIAEQLRSAFRDVEPPVFEKFLENIMYVRSDDEPIRFLREIYPCSDLNQIDLYKFDEILLFLATDSYFYVIPRVLIYLLDDESGMGENFYGTFLHIISIAPRTSELRAKSRKFYAQLSTPQRHAIIAAYQHLSEHHYHDDHSARLLRAAIDYLGKNWRHNLSSHEQRRPRTKKTSYNVKVNLSFQPQKSIKLSP